MSTREEFIENLKRRTKKFAIDVIKSSRQLPDSTEYRIIKGQVIRSSCSVAANYRAASRAISTKPMYSKMKIVEEESDESQFWLEILDELLDVSEKDNLALGILMQESAELTAIFSSSVRSLRSRLGK